MKIKGFLLVICCMIINYTFSQKAVWIFDDEKNYEIPVGIASWEDLKNAAFFQEWNDNYQNYSPNTDFLDSIASLLNNDSYSKYSLKIDVYYGAWCGDSREHVPHFMKILNLLNQYKNINPEINLYACDRDKKTRIETIDKYVNIELVPTFIFSLCLKTGEQICSVELGKIVETPQLSLEKDWCELLKNNLKNINQK